MFLSDSEGPDRGCPSSHQPDAPTSLRFGNGLGKRGDEFEGGDIQERAAGRAKSNAYTTGRGQVATKQKGITNGYGKL